jgi:hypothetical protein
MDYVTINQKVRDPIKIQLHRDSKYKSQNKTIIYEKLDECKKLLNQLKDQEKFSQRTSTYFSHFINQDSEAQTYYPKKIEDLEFAIKTMNLMLFGTADPEDIPPPPPPLDDFEDEGDLGFLHKDDDTGSSSDSSSDDEYYDCLLLHPPPLKLVIEKI